MTVARGFVAAPSGAANLANAGFVTRLLAFAIDIVVLALAISAIEWFISAAEELVRPWGRIELTPAVIACIPVLTGVYFVGLWRLSGQTVGKWLLGIRVVALDGGPVSLGQALARLVGYLISAVPLYAGYLWVLVDPDRRALHDRLARTTVIYIR